MEIYTSKSIAHRSNASDHKVAFAFDGSSPLILIVLKPGDIVDNIEVTITTPFDDPAAALQVGIVANPDLALGPSEIDPDVASTYSNGENFEILVPEILRLLITPGTSTQGAGFVLFTIRR